MPTPSTRLFPYMFWAQTEAWASAYSLAVSGMPAPDASLFDDLGPLDLGPAPVEALPAVRQRLGELFDVHPGRVLISSGASGVMHLLAMRFFPGAHVVTEVPSYEPFRVLSSFYGSSHRILERRAAEGFRLPLEQVQGHLAARGQRPGHLFLCSPHNPTGVISSPADLVRLADLAAEAQGILISNEAYMEFAPVGERVHAFALAPNAISIGTLTKAYGLGSLRIGWAILGEGLVDQYTSLMDHSYLVSVDPPTVCLRAAKRAFEQLEALLQPVRQFEQICRPHLQRWLRDCPDVEGQLGPLGLTAFPRILGVADTHALSKFLAREQEVDAVPGEFFGCPGHLRVGYGVPEATLVEGLRRLSLGISAYKRSMG